MGENRRRLAQAANTSKIAADLALVLTGAPISKTNWANDSNGVRRFDNLLKPDLVAPGNKIVSALFSQYQPIWDHRLYWAGNVAKRRTVSHWPAASGVPANTFVKSVDEVPASSQRLVTAGVTFANPLAGSSSFTGRTGAFRDVALLSGWLASGSGFVLSEGLC